MAKILSIAEHDGSTLIRARRNRSLCADIDGAEIDVAVLAANAPISLRSRARLRVGNACLTSKARERARHCRRAGPANCRYATGYTHVFGPSTTFGKDLMPRVAA